MVIPAEIPPKELTLAQARRAEPSDLSFRDRRSDRFWRTRERRSTSRQTRLWHDLRSLATFLSQAFQYGRLRRFEIGRARDRFGDLVFGGCVNILGGLQRAFSQNACKLHPWLSAGVYLQRATAGARRDDLCKRHTAQ